MSIPKVAKISRSIGTHNGQFHCDEVLACFMLRVLPEYKSTKVTRTRDKSILENCEIVVDVGGIYDHSKLRYDHHQRGFSLTMKDLDQTSTFVTKLSSAGLIYHHYGRRVVTQILEGRGELASSDIEQIFYKVYENFIEEIDAIDNGINQTEEQPKYKVTTTLSNRVKMLNPSWNEEISEDQIYERFECAMELVGGELRQRVHGYYDSWLPARSIVEEAIKDRFNVHKSGQIIRFQGSTPPWKEHLFEIEKTSDFEGKLLYALYQDSVNKSWRIQCVPKDDNSFNNRLSLPEPWRGVRDEALSKLSGIPGCIFVHASGFIGGNSTYAGVLQMAIKSLEMQS